MREPAVLVTGILTLVLSGCVHQVPGYMPDALVASTLKGASAKVKLTLEAPSFSDDGSIMCRMAGLVALPDGQSFSQYVGDALRQELRASEILDETKGHELTLRLQRVDFSSALGATNWFIETEYRARGQRFVVSTVYNDRSSYFGAKACANMALYFRKAVSEHLRQLFLHPSFRTVVELPAEVRGQPGEGGDTAARLRRLDALYRDGLVTKEEYEGRRKQILDGI